MNFKKRFEKRIEEDKKSMLTESDRAFLATLQDMVLERPQGEVLAKPDYKKPLIISVACFMVAALTVFLILHFTLLSKQNGTPMYFTDNFVEVESDMDELNSKLDLFTVEADEDKYSVDVFRTYDSVSGDIIYYRVIISDENGLNIRLHIVVNKNYAHPEMDYSAETSSITISDYTLVYLQTVTPTTVAGTPFNTVNCMGEMQVGKQWIYILSYKEMSLTEGTFIETLQSIIHFN